MSTMPILPIDTMVADCSERDAHIIRAAFTTRGVRNKDDGYAKLRANKPFRRVTTFEEGCANYAWRMLCFDLVGFGKHVCMPVCADFDVCDAVAIRDGKMPRYNEPGYDGWKAAKRSVVEALDALVTQVEEVLPLGAKRGIIRWGQALGVI